MTTKKSYFKGKKSNAQPILSFYTILMDHVGRKRRFQDFDYERIHLLHVPERFKIGVIQQISPTIFSAN